MCRNNTNDLHVGPQSTLPNMSPKHCPLLDIHTRQRRTKMCQTIAVFATIMRNKTLSYR